MLEIEADRYPGNDSGGWSAVCWLGGFAGVIDVMGVSRPR